MDCEIAVIGAGVAGLTAAGALARAGRNVRCLEASGRVGGRILTIHDPLSPLPVEMGAEFIHGLPPETWSIVAEAGLSTYEHSSHALHIDGGRVLDEKAVGERAEKVLEDLAKSHRRKDESFEDFLARCHARPDIKNWARIHVEGFNAARKERISAMQLKEDSDAAHEIEGDRAFRILNGYDALPLHLLKGIPNHAEVMQLHSAVESIRWKRGEVTIRYRSGFDADIQELRCKRAIVTVPLGVLQAGAIGFDPQPGDILEAARTMEFGQVYRVTFRFRERFWEKDDQFKSAGFFISQVKPFFTWWTTLPAIAPMLTGWCAGPAADALAGADRARVFGEALTCLGKILNRPIPRPCAAWFEDWRENPLFGGAYSYVPAGGMPARDALTRPVEDTLYFAGEATNHAGHGGTVHGAIGSASRAVAQILK